AGPRAGVEARPDAHDVVAGAAVDGQQIARVGEDGRLEQAALRHGIPKMGISPKNPFGLGEGGGRLAMECLALHGLRNSTGSRSPNWPSAGLARAMKRLT